MLLVSGRRVRTSGSVASTAVGVNALYRNGGVYNTALGTAAMGNITTWINGNYNTAVGDESQFNNFSGSNNTAVGYWAMRGTNTTGISGSDNTGLGSLSLGLLTSGGNNTAIGSGSMEKSTTGNANTAIGMGALNANTSGGGNVAVGYKALFTGATASNNTAIGDGALQWNAMSSNTAVGYCAMQGNSVTPVTGDFNTALGTEAMKAITSGAQNTAVGTAALTATTTGNYNTGVGTQALQRMTNGYSNVGVGEFALSGLTSGSANVAIGKDSGMSITTGQNNIYLGYGVGNTINESYTIRIGTQNSQSSTYIAGISGVNTTGGTAVYVNSLGKLGTLTSSRVFKHEIRDMDADSRVLMSLRPVSFKYKPEIDPTQAQQYGLIAEEVEEKAPQLVVYDTAGKPMSVHYNLVNAMLLNEVQRLNRDNKVLQDKVDALKKQNDRELSSMSARLDTLARQLKTGTSLRR